MYQLDFMLSPQGDVVIKDNNLSMLEGNEIYIQAFRQLLQTRLGEYFLNSDEGMDFDVFLGRKEFNEDEMTQALYDVASQLNEFVKFARIDFDFDKASRKLTIYFEALFSEFNYEGELEVDLFG